VKAVANWRQVLRWAWSVRLMVLAAVLSGVEIALPYFAESFPRLVFVGLSFLATVGAVVARFVAQEKVSQ
jgi:hypothetical protein